MKIVKLKQDEINIVLCGVGGQGILLASDIIVDLALNSGLDAKKSEIHGMAQRGGSVLSQARFGKKIHSPLIKKGEADIILSFEKLEAIRYLDYLKPDGWVIFNNQQITPLTVYTSKIEYPKNIEAFCKKKTPNVLSIDAIQTAEQLGNPKVLNIIMLGTLSHFLDFSTDLWLKTIKTRVPKKTINVNLEAFEQGQKLIDS